MSRTGCDFHRQTLTKLNHTTESVICSNGGRKLDTTHTPTIAPLLYPIWFKIFALRDLN